MAEWRGGGQTERPCKMHGTSWKWSFSCFFCSMLDSLIIMRSNFEFSLHLNFCQTERCDGLLFSLAVKKSSRIPASPRSIRSSLVHGCDRAKYALGVYVVFFSVRDDLTNYVD